MTPIYKNKNKSLSKSQPKSKVKILKLANQGKQVLRESEIGCFGRANTSRTANCFYNGY